MRVALVRVLLLLAVPLFSAAWATTFVVSPDGSGDFPTIREAIDAAVDGDTIELTDGTFAGEENRNLDFTGKAITVRSQSGNPQTCIIDCEAGDGDPDAVQRGFLFHSMEGYASVLTGLTITNGAATAP